MAGQWCPLSFFGVLVSLINNQPKKGCPYYFKMVTGLPRELTLEAERTLKLGMFSLSLIGFKRIIFELRNMFQRVLRLGKGLLHITIDILRSLNRIQDPNISGFLWTSRAELQLPSP